MEVGKNAVRETEIKILHLGYRPILMSVTILNNIGIFNIKYIWNRNTSE